MKNPRATLNFIVAVACFSGVQGVTKTFSDISTTLDTPVLNPERGFYYATETLASAPDPLYQADLESYRSQNISLVFRSFTLDTFLSTNISSAFLKSVENDLNVTKSAGMKMVVRFCYTLIENKYPSDAALSQLLKHVEQVTPILKNWSDVVVVLQAGFIGTWGEWYYSKNYATDDGSGNFAPTNTQWGYRVQIIEKLLTAIPATRMLQLRYVGAIQQYLNKTTNIAPANAFTGTKESRIGLHNDCFLTPYMDQGTFDSTAQQTWLAQQANYVMVGGETCAVTTGRTDCTNAMAEIQKYHWTYLNTNYHDVVVANWKTGGCYEKIKSMLGYRYQLLNATFPTSMGVNTALSVTISFKNTGTAPLYNSHNIRLALRNRSTAAVTYLPNLQYDIRQVMPGSVVTLSFNNQSVSGVAAGSYDLLVDINDASNVMNSYYRVLFVNRDTRDSSRMNILSSISIA